MITSSKSLARFHRKVAGGNNVVAPGVLIAALGDSVTFGSGAEDEVLGDDVYHAKLQRLLAKRYPRCNFSVLNAGENGQNAGGGLAQLEKSVLPLQPDLLLIGYGLNDATAGELDGLKAYASALETLIQRTRETTNADIILLTPNMMPRRDNDKIPERWRHVTQQFIRLQNDGILAAYAQCVREVGKRNDVFVADVYGAWEELEKRGVDTTALLANGLNHPDASGHEIAAGVLLQCIIDNEPKEVL